MTDLFQQIKDDLKNHVLTCELDTPDYKAFYMREPGTRAMSCRIIFTPEGIAIMGDLVPERNGSISALGYNVDWFSGQLGAGYLSEKFLAKSFQPDEAAKEIRLWIKEKAEHGISDEDAEELTDLADRLEFGHIGAEGLRDLIPSDCENMIIDYFPGFTYSKKEQAILCAIQQRFAELYHAPNTKETP